MKKYHFETIDSTSIYLKNNYQSYQDMTFVSSNFQVSGHGRYNRKWESENGENLLFSILIKDKILINNYASLSLASASVIYKVLKDLNVENVSIKWPNDVYVNDKKISGILLESISFSNKIEALILGVGINVNSFNFSDDLKDEATSVYLEIGKTTSIEEFKEKVYSEFLKMFNEIKNNVCSYLEIIRKNNYLKDKKVYANVNNKKILVEVIDVNEDNSLKVKKGNEFINLYSGEVTFKI